MKRTYLDHNATTPVRVEAKNAMLDAIDVIGNPSSVHAEGRAAMGVVQKARRQIAVAFGVGENEIVFTSSATEAAALALSQKSLRGSAIEHDSVSVWTTGDVPVSKSGQVVNADVLQAANSETGVIQCNFQDVEFCDMTQAFGKIPMAFEWSGAKLACASAHKLGGPKGVGCLILKRGTEIPSLFRGGGQELGRRAGTENVIGIAGFGAAAEAAAEDLAQGKWLRVEKLRNILETALEESGKPIISVGKDSPRLPNTCCYIAPGWKGETQVMAMDLAGFAISAGSACSSGKVKASRVLKAMGYSEAESASAVRVSLGLNTTEAEVLKFAEAWLSAYDKQLARAA